MKPLIIVGLILTLSACCSPGVKPEDANIFQAACGVSSGQYQRDLDAAEAEAAASASEREATEQTSLQLEATAASKQKELELLQARLASVRAESEQLKRALDAEVAGKQQVDAEVTEQREQLQRNVTGRLVWYPKARSHYPGRCNRFGWMA